MGNILPPLRSDSECQHAQVVPLYFLRVPCDSPWVATVSAQGPAVLFTGPVSELLRRGSILTAEVQSACLGPHRPGLSCFLWEAASSGKLLPLESCFTWGWLIPHPALTVSHLWQVFSASVQTLSIHLGNGWSVLPVSHYQASLRCKKWKSFMWRSHRELVRQCQLFVHLSKKLLNNNNNNHNNNTNDNNTLSILIILWGLWGQLKSIPPNNNIFKSGETSFEEWTKCYCHTQ